MFQRSFLFGVLVLAIAASSASAATFGDPLTAEPTTNSVGLSYVMAYNEEGTPFAGSPITGVLTSIRIRTTGDAGTETATVERRTAAWSGGVADHVKIAEFPFAVTADATAAGHITESPARVPIAAGDTLGLEHPIGHDGVKVFNAWAAATSDTCGYHGGTGDQAVGGTVSFQTITCNTTWPMIQATVEADADNDGYGDETQDLCPTDASRQTACLIPATIVLKAVKSTSKTASSASRSFTLTNTGQVASALVPFSIKSSKKVKNLRIVKGCKPTSKKKPTSCSIASIAPGATVTIKVSLSIKAATKTTLTATSGALKATSTVKLKAKKK